MDRFNYPEIFDKSCTYSNKQHTAWPSANDFKTYSLDFISLIKNAFNDQFRLGLSKLKYAIDEEWRQSVHFGKPAQSRFDEQRYIVQAMHQIQSCLSNEDDQLAIQLRIKAIEQGYDNEILAALADLNEDIAVVAGQISTWYGKKQSGLPTAFACRRDNAAQNDVITALENVKAEVSEYLKQLHIDLSIGDLPAFTATQLFFMAGEGNLHPKHIAYFLPEDEGIKNSSFKKTYYFRNTHNSLIEKISAPLVQRLVQMDVAYKPEEIHFAKIPTLGVLSHELGHFVHRPATCYQQINSSHRWASIALQEIAADVFGILILAEVWSKKFHLSPADIIMYYLGECLRYVNRGLGYFPDSDGMFFQLSYFVQLGALTIENNSTPCLYGDPNTVLAGLRSLARVLADALLSGKAEPALALYNHFGPKHNTVLQPVLDFMALEPPISIEYTQE